MRIDDTLSVDESLIEERFVRASGPGGQNVNKVATAVELRFAFHAFDALSPSAKARLARLAGRRLTDEGVIVIRADEFRTQDRNRDAARQRLADMIRTALVAPKPRIATKPGKAARARRLDGKARRSDVKRMRSKRVGDE